MVYVNMEIIDLLLNSRTSEEEIFAIMRIIIIDSTISIYNNNLLIWYLYETAYLYVPVFLSVINLFKNLVQL